MSRIEKLTQRLRSRPKDFTWPELRKVLNQYGFEEHVGRGSRRKFIHEDGRMIIIHEPHSKKAIKLYVIDLVLENLGIKRDE